MNMLYLLRYRSVLPYCMQTKLNNIINLRISTQNILKNKRDTITVRVASLIGSISRLGILVLHFTTPF
jgi:hypothetical protein